MYIKKIWPLVISPQCKTWSLCGEKLAFCLNLRLLYVNWREMLIFTHKQALYIGVVWDYQWSYFLDTDINLIVMNCCFLTLLEICIIMVTFGFPYYLNFVDIFFFLTNEHLGKICNNEMTNGQLWINCLSNNIFICWLRLAENSVSISLAIRPQEHFMIDP